MSVAVVLEQRGGTWNRVSFEAVSAGRALANALQTDLEVLLLGSELQQLAGEAARLGVQKVWTLDHALLADYTADGFTAALEQWTAAQKPAAIVFPHTYQVRDFAPKLAARLRVPLVSDVIEIKTGGSAPVLVRQLFQGKLNADVPLEGSLNLVSVQAGAFRAPDAVADAAPVESFSVQLEPAQIRSKPEAPFREAQRSVDLGAADLIVSVGRGIKDKDNLSLVEDLASALGAELAASHPVCDNGWLPMERQVGSSGQTVAPKLYIAIGISGAIQHLVGMKGAKTVVAINKDESAPIFETADYGIVADLFEVVPALTEQVKKAKA